MFVNSILLWVKWILNTFSRGTARHATTCTRWSNPCLSDLCIQRVAFIVGQVYDAEKNLVKIYKLVWIYRQCIQSWQSIEQWSITFIFVKVASRLEYLQCQQIIAPSMGSWTGEEQSKNKDNAKKGDSKSGGILYWWPASPKSQSDAWPVVEGPEDGVWLIRIAEHNLSSRQKYRVHAKKNVQGHGHSARPSKDCRFLRTISTCGKRHCLHWRSWFLRWRPTEERLRPQRKTPGRSCFTEFSACEVHVVDGRVAKRSRSSWNIGSQLSKSWFYQIHRKPSSGARMFIIDGQRCVS